MWRKIEGCTAQHVGVFRQLQHQGLRLRAGQRAQICCLETCDIAAPRSQHRTNTGMGVLDVINRVVVIFSHGQVNIKGVLGVWFAAK